MRLYSSAPADLLDIHYESPDGRWCLGGKFPVARGWATYRVDLSKNSWRETRAGEDSKQWGGPSKRVSALRIDPGNQADRWIAVDYVALQEPEAGQAEGVTIEPQGHGRITQFDAPETVEAGSSLNVTARLEIEPSPDMPTVTAFVRLRSGKTIVRLEEKPLERSGTSAVLNVTPVDLGLLESRRVDRGGGLL